MSQASIFECPRCYPSPSPSPTLLRTFDALYSQNHLLGVNCQYTTKIIEDLFSQTVDIFSSLENDPRRSFEWVWHNVHDEIMRKFVGWKLPPDYSGEKGKEGEGDGEEEVSPGWVERVESMKCKEWYKEKEAGFVRPWADESDPEEEVEEAVEVAEEEEPEEEEEEKEDLPLAVKKYTLSAFSELNQIEGIGWRAINTKLQEIIDESREEGTLWSRDWKKILLPQQVLQNERDETW